MSVKQGSSFALVAYVLLVVAPSSAQETAANNELVTRPVISEEVSPLIRIEPTAADGHQGEGFLRRPPGEGPFPAVVLIHGGLSRLPTEVIRQYSLRPYPSRFLEAGYVVAVITYRSRDQDPQSQSPESVADALAAVDLVKNLPFVDPNSVVVNGSSGGGDLALEVAAATDLAAIATEEPAAILMSGIATAEVLAEVMAEVAERMAAAGATGAGRGGPGGRGGRGGRGGGRGMTFLDVAGEIDFVQLFRAAGENETLTEKASRIRSPVLVIQGSPSNLNLFNEEILIPTLQAAGVSVAVRTYPGEIHGFAFNDRSLRPAMVLRAFEDIDVFFREYIPTQPSSVDPSLVEHVALQVN